MALPPRVTVGGKVYVLHAAIIHTKNDDGTPKLVGLMRDKDTIELAGGEEFLTCYLPLSMTLPSKIPDGIPDGL